MEKAVALPNPRVSRRDFLKIAEYYAKAFAVAVPIALAYLGISQAATKLYLAQEATIKTAKLTKRFKESSVVHPEEESLPEVMRGFYVNTAYLYLEPRDEWKYYIDQSRELKATRARIMFGNELQSQELTEFTAMLNGESVPEALEHNFNEAVLDQAASYAKELNKNITDEREKIYLEVDFMDAFFLGNGALIKNAAYGGSKITSAYNLTKDQAGYRNFFTDENLKKAFKARMRHIVEGMRARRVDNISNWSIINEPIPELIGEDGVEILTQWYREMVDYLRNDLGVRDPIVTGLRYPWDIKYEEIDGLTANTMHLYLPILDPIRLESYLRSHKEKVIVQEFGTPYEIFGIRLPPWLYKYARWRLIDDIMRVALEFRNENGNKVVIPKVESVGGWKLEPRDDKFTFELEHMSEEELAEILELHKLR